MADENDPLAEFRGEDVQIGGISRKIAGQIHPAAFRQISQSATSDQVSGDPRHYDAFVSDKRGQEILDVRPVTGIWQSPSYRYLMNTLFNSVSGTVLILVFSFIIVKIQGRNLAAIRRAILAHTCEFIQEYHPNEFSPPDKDAPVITKIEIIVRGEDEAMSEIGKIQR